MTCRNFSSPTRDPACAPSIRSSESVVLVALGLCCCAWAFSSCRDCGLLFVAVLRLLTGVASVAEHGL